MVRGVIEFFDMRKGFGNLKGPNDKMFFFSKSSLSAKGKPDKQQEVEFEEEKNAEIKEDQKPVAINVSPLEGESFNTERRRKKPADRKGGNNNDSGNGLAGRISALEKKLDSKGSGGGSLESRLDKLEGKINEICEKLDIKKLGGGKGNKGGRGSEKGSGKGSGRKGSKGGRSSKGKDRDSK